MSPRRTRRTATIEGKPELHVADPVEPITPQPNEDDELPFFTQLKRYSEAEWDRLLVYLYRLEPRVKNSDGPAYIEKFGRAIDEDDIKNAHGGGKYQVWLKDTATDETVRKVNITIAGAPILQPNQILQAGLAATTPPSAGPPVPVAAVAPPQDPALAAVLKLLGDTLHQIKSEKPSQEIANQMLIDTMQKANTISMEMVKSQVMRPEGGGITDKFLAVAMERMLKEKDPLAELTKTMDLMKLMRPDPPPAQPSGDALGSLKLVKDALGLDVKEMLELKAGAGGDGGNAWQSAAVNALPGIVEAVPKVFEQLNHGKRIELEIQRTQLQREQLQLRAMEIQRGLPPTPIAPQVPAAAPPPGAVPRVEAAPPAIPPLDPPPATTAPGAASAAPADPAATSAEAEVNEMAALVVRCFRAGRTGDQTAEVAEFSFPAVVGQLEPFIDSVATVDAVVRSNAVLAQMVTDPRYPVFLDEFVDYFIGEDEELDEKEPEGVRAGV